LFFAATHRQEHMMLGMKVLRYGEKVIAACANAPQNNQATCSTENCSEPSSFHVDFRGSSKRTVEFCVTHLQAARDTDVEFDRQMRDFEAAHSKSSSG
jgi:hypothetical protein